MKISTTFYVYPALLNTTFPALVLLPRRRKEKEEGKGEEERKEETTAAMSSSPLTTMPRARSRFRRLLHLPRREKRRRGGKKGRGKEGGESYRGEKIDKPKVYVTVGWECEGNVGSTGGHTLLCRGTVK